MVNDIEPSILLSIAIIAIIIGIVAITITVVTINNGQLVVINPECDPSCGSLPLITNNSCVENLYGNCTTIIEGSVTNPITAESLSILMSPISRPPPESCAGFCKDAVIVGPEGNPICPTGDPDDPGNNCVNKNCDPNTEDCRNVNCNYYQCLNTITYLPECSNSAQSLPIACFGNTLYYLYSALPDPSVITPCICGAS